jgi:ABC-type phosphate transport system ATPase subunit
MLLDARALASSEQASAPPAPMTPPPAKIDVKGMNFYYGTQKALDDINLKVFPNQVTAFIGPSGCGKSTFLRSLNRMNDIIPETRVEGSIQVDGQDIYAPSVDVVDLRRRIGWSSRSPTPSPSPSSTTSRTGCGSTGWPARATNCAAGSKPA